MTDLRLCELLAARICHDLVGPVGAVSNGIELMGEDGSGADPEVIKLVAGSARLASRRLQAYRVAFGSANTLPTAGCINAVRELALGVVEEGKASLDWPMPAPDIEAGSDKRMAKLLLNIVLLALESMVRAGTVRLSMASASRSLVVTVHGGGGQGRLSDEVRAGLEGVFDLDTSTPKAAPAYLAACLAREIGGTLAVSGDGAQEFEIRLTIPARA